MKKRKFTGQQKISDKSGNKYYKKKFEYKFCYL